MTLIAATPGDFIARLIAVLIALFGASARAVARVRALRGRVRESFARLALRRAARGRALIYAGEDDAAVDARIARLQWIARDPWKALRHLCRDARGWLRARLCLEAAPTSFAPPRVACAAPADGAAALTRAPET